MNYKKEYKKYLTSSILDTANNKIASSSLITAFAVYLGLSDLAIGIYAVLDTITNMLQIFAAPLFSKIGQSKIVVLSNYTIYRLASVGFAFIPFISDNITIRTIFFFIFASIYAVTGEMGYITFVNWRMTLVKKEDRTKFASSKNMIKNTVVMAFSLFMGVILDKFKANGYELNGFLILFGIVFIIAFIDIMIRINTYKPKIENKPITIKESISRPAKDKSFKKVLITAGINRFALGIGTMYLNVYLLRYLHINYVYYSILKDMKWFGDIESHIIKIQHNCFSDNKVYNNNSFIAIKHEHILIFKKNKIWIYNVKATNSVKENIMNSTKITWRDLIQATIEFLNNKASIEEIYNILKKSKKAKNNNYVREKIRQTLNNNDNFVKSGTIWSLCIES